MFLGISIFWIFFCEALRGRFIFIIYLFIYFFIIILSGSVLLFWLSLWPGWFLITRFRQKGGQRELADGQITRDMINVGQLHSKFGENLRNL